MPGARTAPRRWPFPLTLCLATAIVGCGGTEPVLVDAKSAPQEVPRVVPASVAPYDAAGPYEVVREWGGPGGAFTIYYPRALGADGRMHPILTWGNGTFTVPLLYEGLLRHLASHGMVIIASHSMMTGTGREMLQGLDWLIAEARNPRSRFYQKLDVEAVGTIGHSQGGGGSINAGGDARVRAVAPIQPAPGNIARVRAPIFLLGGSLDWIVSPDLVIRPFSYLPATAPTVFGILLGADHFRPLGNADGYRGYLTAWFKHHLMGDDAAGALFYGERCGLCIDAAWVVERKNL